MGKHKTAIRKSNKQVVKLLSYNEKDDIYFCSYVIKRSDKFSELVNYYIPADELIISDVVDIIYD